MGSMVNKNSIRISRNPEFFVSDLMKPGKDKPPGIADLSFFDQITGKYGHTAGFIKTQLYYLYFPKQVKSLKKNLSINFFIHSHFRIRPKINLHFEVSRRSHDKARGGRIASYLTDEQRSHAGWIGASKCEVVFERALNIFPAIVKNIGYFNRNFIENRQEDIFLTKISNLLKALRFNLSSQPVLHFQNIAIRAVKKLLKINHESAKVQKHEIRPGNQVANIFFHDTSFFTYPRLNPISNRADRNIVEKKSKLMHNLVISEVTGPEKNYISISHPNCRPFLIHPYLQNPRNRITIPPVLLNVSGHIFAKRSAAGRQARSDWINHISPASESDTDILFFSDFLRGGQKRLKFYEKQSRQRSGRHGGMELAVFPYTGVSSMIKSFAKPGSIKFSPAVPRFLQMEISNKGNIEHKMFTFPEKGLASYYMARSHHITTIANLFRHADVHTRVKYFFKSYLTEFPVTIASRRRKIFSLYDNVTNEKQSNILKETIAQPISLIPFEETATSGADLRSLPATFSKLPVMHGNPLLEAKDTDFHLKKRARKQPIESDTAQFNIMKNINFDKKSINSMRYIPFSDYNSERPQGAKNLFSRLKYSTKSRILRHFAPQNDNLRCSVNNSPHIEERKNLREEIGRKGSISTQEPSMAGYRNNFPDMTYFSSNISPHSTHMAGSGEGKKKTEFLKVDSSYKTDHTKLLSVPGPDLYGLADKVYGLIVERIKRERELRGR